MTIDPNFIVDQDSLPKDGFPTILRNTVYVIIHNPKTDEYLCLDWQKFNWKTFIIGGIDEGETAKEAGFREIQEETGYTNLRFVREIGKSTSMYFAAHKNVNRIADATGVLFELIDDHKIETNEEETKYHVPVWVKSDKVENYLDRSSQKHMWKLYIESK